MSNKTNKNIIITIAMIILFLSCTENQELDFQYSEKKYVEAVVEKHIQKMDELAYILRNEKDINLFSLKKSSNSFVSKSQLKNTTEKSKIANVEKITLLLSEIQENINTFISTRKDDFNESEINRVLSFEINKYIDFEIANYSNTVYSSSCESQCYQNYWTANSRCERNWYIGVAGLAVSGFFTLGTGTVVGAGIVGTMLIVCEVDSQNDRDACLRRCNNRGKEDEDPRAPMPF